MAAIEMKSPKSKSGSGGGDEFRVVHCSSSEKTLLLKYPNNTISNTKYTWWNFFPKNFMEQFSLHINRYFLVIAILQCFSSITPVNPITTWIPLIIIFAISATKEAVDDRTRSKEDKKANETTVPVYRNGVRTEVQSQYIEVGDLVWLKEDDQIMCDLVVLTTSDNGHCFIQTTNLDGETNLKDRNAPNATQKLPEAELHNFKGVIQCALPDKQVYKFDSCLWLEASGDLGVPNQQPIPLSASQLLQQGCRLRNTEWVLGVAVYTGNQTKFGMNKDTPPLKLTQTDLFINKISVFIFIFQLCLVVILGVIGEERREKIEAVGYWYLLWNLTTTKWWEYIVVPLRFLLLNSTMIPISLKVSLDLCKAFYAKFISSDKLLADPETGERAVPNSTSISEDLGQIEYVLTDKTGTLTQNNMVFDRCTVGGEMFLPEDCEKGGKVGRMVASGKADEVVEFFRNIALNSAVVPLQVDPNHEEFKHADEQGFVYKGASPDEVALVKAAALQGVRLVRRTTSNDKDLIEITLPGGAVEGHSVLVTLEFSSDRKRMSMLLRNEKTNALRLFTKGADDVLVPRCLGSKENKQRIEQTQAHVDACASLGLRTLFFGYRDVSQGEYEEWKKEFERASTLIQGREEGLAAVYEKLEKDFLITGASAIEDKLQDQVPETIEVLRRAGIKFWMLTGDKFTTALQIATSCNLKSPDAVSKLCVVEGTSAATTKESLASIVTTQFEINSTYKRPITKEDHGSSTTQLKANPQRETAVIVTGEVLKFAIPDQKVEAMERQLELATKRNDVSAMETLKKEIELDKDNKATFAKVCLAAHTVIGCRVTPAQKAELVRLVKSAGKMALAIGDGGNDVAMIQAAHIGVGIRGKEGLQAARAADYAVGMFSALKRLVLVHGQYSYMRTSLVALYSFYKSMFFCLMQLFYSWFTSYSGVTLFNTLCVAAYNALLFFPIVTLIMDQSYPFEVALAAPKLYAECAKRQYLNYKLFFWWMLRALYQALVVFHFSLASRGLSYHKAGTGYQEDYETLGIAAFLLYLWIQAITLQLEMHYVTWVNAVFVWIFHVGAFLLLIITNNMRSMQSYNGYKIVDTALGDPTVWLLHLVAVVAAMAPVVVVRFDNFRYRPERSDFLRWQFQNDIEGFKGIADSTSTSTQSKSNELEMGPVHHKATASSDLTNKERPSSLSNGSSSSNAYHQHVAVPVAVAVPMPATGLAK